MKRDIKEEIKILNCDYDSAKSFYNNAHVKITSLKMSNCGYILYDGMIKIDLYSYNTLVLTIYKDIKNHVKDTYILYNDVYNLTINNKDNNGYSNTTMRHVRECLKQYYYNEIHTTYFNIYNYSKKQIFKRALWQ